MIDMHLFLCLQLIVTRKWLGLMRGGLVPALHISSRAGVHVPSQLFTRIHAIDTQYRGKKMHSQSQLLPVQN